MDRACFWTKDENRLVLAVTASTLRSRMKIPLNESAALPLVLPHVSVRHGSCSTPPAVRCLIVAAAMSSAVRSSAELLVAR